MIAVHHWRDNGIQLHTPGLSSALVQHAIERSTDDPKSHIRARATKQNNARASVLLSASLRMEGNMILGDTILETRGLTKEFKGFTAVNGVNLRVRRGSIHALIGPNGAGKTTCFNLLTKFLEPTRGTDRLQRHRHHARTSRAYRAARRDPLVSDFRRISASDGPAERAHRIAARARHVVSFLDAASARSIAQRSRAWICSRKSVLTDFADTKTVELSYGRKRALEIATTLAMEPELMLLDEPTQGMGHEDVDRVTALIKKVSAGRTILMVEHNMNVIAGISDTITVLQRGEVLAEGSYAEVSKNPLVMEAYMGSADAALAGAHA